MLNHIAIAVKRPENFIEVFKKLGFVYENSKEVEREGVRVHFLLKDGLKIELLEPLNENSKVLNFIEKKGETFHHIAISVKDISREIEKLKEKNFKFVDERPREGGEDGKIAFIHPKSSCGILIELCEIKDEDK